MKNLCLHFTFADAIISLVTYFKEHGSLSHTVARLTL
jgi:hypothetical protein